MDFFAASQAVAKAKEMDLATMELVFRLENSGEDFYNALADRIDNEEAAELLRRNGREEARSRTSPAARHLDQAR